MLKEMMITGNVLWDICSIVSAFEVNKDDAAHLAWLIEIYLESFTSLYEDPKFHIFHSK